MDKHDKISELLINFLTGEVSEEQKLEVEEHLIQCAICREELKRLASLLDLTEKIGHVKVDENLHESVKENLLKKAREGKYISKKTGIINWRKIMNNKITKFAAAAIILITAGITIAVLNDTNDITDVPQDTVAVEPSVQNGTETTTVTKTTLNEELAQIEQMFTAGDTTALAKMLSEGQYESKIAAANYLAQLGDTTSIEQLEQLAAQWTGDVNENPFLNAAEEIKNTSADVIVLTSTDSNEQQDTQSPKATPIILSSEILEILPEETMFCVRINNFDYSLGKIDQYLSGVLPVPMGVAMLGRMQLAGLVADPALNNVNTTGSFAVFGLSLSDETTNSSMSDLFMGALVPVTDFDKFVSDNQNCSNADANNICIIQSGMKKIPAICLGNCILVGMTKDYNQLALAAKLISAGKTKLADSLDTRGVKQAKEGSVWLYGSIQQASKTFGPMVNQQLEQMKTQLKQMKSTNPNQPTPPATIMNIYFGLLDIIINEVDLLAVGINPQPDSLDLNITTVAVPDTYIAKAFATNPAPQTENKLLGYLEDGSMLNVTLRMNTPFWEELNLTQYELASLFSEDEISDEGMEKLEKTVSDMITSAGDYAIFSWGLAPDSSFPFKYTAVFNVEDAQKWTAANRTLIELWNTEDFSGAYSETGIATSYNLQENVYTYKGVSVDYANFGMKSADPNSAYGKMVDDIYGSDGINFMTATTDGLSLFVLSGDCNSTMNNLIDTVKQGGPQQLSTEVQNMLTILPETKNADFAGTLNYARMLEMAITMNPMLKNTSLQTEPVKSNSSVVFSGKTDNGQLISQIVIPKEHLTEVMIVFGEMQKAIMQAQMPNQNTTTEQPTDSNSKPSDTNAIETVE